MRRVIICLTICSTVTLFGCDEPSSTPTAGSSASSDGPPASPMDRPPLTKEEIDARSAEPEPIEKVAGVGAGEKGTGYGGGIISEPARQYWRIQERITFDINIPRAMRDYKAFNDGKAPATEEIYMKEIIEKYGIDLPDLPTGHTYFYDPKKGELMIRIPNPEQ